MATDFGDDIMEMIFDWGKRNLKITPEDIEKIQEWFRNIKECFTKAELEGDLAKMNFDSPEMAQKVKEIADKMGIECEIVNSSVVVKTSDFEKLSDKVNELEQKTNEVAKEVKEQTNSEKASESKEVTEKDIEDIFKEQNIDVESFDKDNRVSLDDEIKDAQVASKELASQAKTQVHEKVIDVGEVAH